MHIRRIFEVVWWIMKSRNHVTEVIVYMTPNVTTKTPSRIFRIKD